MQLVIGCWGDIAKCEHEPTCGKASVRDAEIFLVLEK